MSLTVIKYIECSWIIFHWLIWIVDISALFDFLSYARLDEKKKTKTGDIYWINLCFPFYLHSFTLIKSIKISHQKSNFTIWSLSMILILAYFNFACILRFFYKVLCILMCWWWFSCAWVAIITTHIQNPKIHTTNFKILNIHFTMLLFLERKKKNTSAIFYFYERNKIVNMICLCERDKNASKYFAFHWDGFSVFLLLLLLLSFLYLLQKKH